MINSQESKSNHSESQDYIKYWPMDRGEIQQYKNDLEEMKKFAIEVSLSKEKALKFLQDAGIVTSTGELTELYR